MTGLPRLLGSVPEVLVASVLIGAELISISGAIVVVSMPMGVVSEPGDFCIWEISNTPAATNMRIKKIAGPRALVPFALRRFFFAFARAFATIQLWQV